MHRTFENYYKIKKLIYGLHLHGNPKNMYILLNGNSFDWFNENSVDEYNNGTPGKFIFEDIDNESSIDNFLQFFIDYINVNNCIKIFNLGEHEFICGKEKWIRLINLFADIKKSRNNIFILNSNLGPGFGKDIKNIANNIDKHVIRNGIGYVGWISLNIISDTYTDVYLNENDSSPIGYYPEDWFEEDWITHAVELQNLISGKAGNNIKVEDNGIFIEFKNNVKNCICELAKNSPGMLYLNVAASADKNEILPVLDIVFSELKKSNEIEEEVFKRLAVNVIVRHPYREGVPVLDADNPSMPPYCLKDTNNPLSPVRNIAAPGPFGDHAVIFLFKDQRMEYFAL
jgi:hypothetical protein